MSDHIEIQLPRGMVALISPCDFDLVSPIKWQISRSKSCTGRTRYYASSGRTGEKLPMHRLILGLTKEDKIDVDHINGDGLDNRRENLRKATRSENLGNRRIVWSKCGFKGVWKLTYASGNQKFGAKCARKTLGVFDTAEEAALAYDKAALELWGEFAATNKMLGLLP